jgi:hypothetical protein
MQNNRGQTAFSLCPVTVDPKKWAKMNRTSGSLANRFIKNRGLSRVVIHRSP